MMGAIFMRREGGCMLDKSRVSGETWEQFKKRPGRDWRGWTKKEFEATMTECSPPPCTGSLVQKPKNETLVYITSDTVNHPSHYTAGGIECIDALEAATVNLAGIDAVCTANAIKYLWRWKQKNGVEDLKKAQWYINKLIEKQGE
jgi:hypothetical protein